MDWSTWYKEIGPVNFTKMLKRPAEWQVPLADRVRSAVGTGRLLEAGSAFGLTSLLVGEQASRTLLDLEPKAIEIARELFSTAGQQAEFIEGDLFHMPFPDDYFDVVFNAGVLEHFDFAGRRAALIEMARVASPGGKICVAVPNHYSVPYRYAYEYRKARNTWRFPDEERIFDFAEELIGVEGVKFISRETVAERTCFSFLSKLDKLRFKILHRFKKFEGYLAIVMLEKGAGPAGKL